MKNKGITLVSLVITIIILLILAGISIIQLTGSGLFENAKLAEQKSKEAQEKEESILSDYENIISSQLKNSKDIITEKDVKPDSELATLLKEANMTITLEDILNTPAIMKEVNGLIPVITESDVTREEINEEITYKHSAGGIIRIPSEHSEGIYNACKAFDNDISTHALSAEDEAAQYYLEYEFKETVYAMQIKYMFSNGSIRGGTREFVIQGYDEQNNIWEDLTGNLTWTGTSSTKTEEIQNLNYTKPYKRYRVYVKSATYTSSSYKNGGKWSGFYSLQLYGVDGLASTEEDKKRLLLENSNLKEITLNQMVTNPDFAKRLINALSLETVTNNEILMANLQGLIPAITENDVTREVINEEITYKVSNGAIIRIPSEHSEGIYSAWKAFDNDISTHALSAEDKAAQYYLEYEFKETVYAMQIKYMFSNGSIRGGIREFVIQGYDEQNNIWEDLTGNLTWTGTSSTKTEEIQNLNYTKPYKRYRVYVKSATYTSSSYKNGGKWSGFYSLQLYGKKAN